MWVRGEWQDMTLVTPTPLDAGDVVIFDYRVWHRGLANRAMAFRPMFYLTLTAPSVKDTRNFASHALSTPPLWLADEEEARDVGNGNGDEPSSLHTSGGASTTAQ
jgi:ectoine hydroxylase-related dioxygenase (phytanoyl-CoA dioxygenase family)